MLIFSKDDPNTCFTLLAHEIDKSCPLKSLFYCLANKSFPAWPHLSYKDNSFALFAWCFCQSVAEAAEDLWDRYGHDFGTDYSGLFKALSHIHYNVRFAAAEALAAALDESPDTIQVCRFELNLLDFYYYY